MTTEAKTPARARADKHRDEIVTFLQRNPVATTGQIRDALGYRWRAFASVLRVLEADGVVTAVDRRGWQGAIRWSLTDEYRLLCSHGDSDPCS